MIKSYFKNALLYICVALVAPFNVFSSEKSFEADIFSRAEYNDNIFLTVQEHDSVSGIILTPSLLGLIKEVNWDASLAASMRISKYSDDSLDGNDKFFDLAGRYISERNIFSLNVNYDLDSNLSSTSTDFGIAGRRVNRESQSIAPQYTRLLTERLVFLLSYTYSSVDYLDAENTGFVPYVTESVSGSLIYDFSERDKVTFSLTAVDYRSENDMVTYQLFVSRIALDHKFTETLSSDFHIGVSRRNSTNLLTQSFDFFGQPIVITQVIDGNNRGLVFGVGIKQLFETGQIEGRLSRDENTNSFGGLDEINQISINYLENITGVWRYSINARFENVESVNSGTSTTDRNLLLFESAVNYSISQNWKANASYRYSARRFKSDISENRAPHSNRIYFGLTYNFQPLSTF